MKKEREADRNLMDQKSVHVGVATVPYTPHGWALPGGFITPDRKAAFKMAERMNKAMTS